MSSNLTAQQQQFLKVLFSTANGSMAKAAKEVLGTEDYSDLITEELLTAIKKRADQELSLNVAKAVFVMSKLLNDPDTLLFGDKLHKVAADILDRAGISKQERPQQNTMTVGIVMLPSKNKLDEPPPIEIKAEPVMLPDLI